MAALKSRGRSSTRNLTDTLRLPTDAKSRLLFQGATSIGPDLISKMERLAQPA